jgi:hypothetical protein
VFGTATAIAGASSVIAGSGALTGALTRMRRTLASRAAAYALAAACLALSIGLAVHHSPGAQTIVMLPASGPHVARSAQQAARVDRPPVGGSHAGAARARVAADSPAEANTRQRQATATSGSGRSSVAATEPSVTVVADAGGSSDGGPSTPARPDASSTEAPRAVTPEGDTKAGVKTTKDPHGSSGPGHSASTDGHLAQPAETHPRDATTPAHESGTRHLTPAAKDREGKHSAQHTRKKDHTWS